MKSKPYTANITNKPTNMQQALFCIGLIAIVLGLSVLGLFGIRKLHREYQKQKLMRNNPVVEIADLKIKAPILEGTDNDTLSKAAGHFIGTGELGKGNYCIAGHSSTLYKEYFNNLKNIEIGMEITLYDTKTNSFEYTVKETFIVEPSETWVLNDFGDDRVTIITCTDDGTQRLVVIGEKYNHRLKDEQNKSIFKEVKK